jgi:DNA/RNA endonuclease YhcR with UshA esterase domain
VFIGLRGFEYSHRVDGHINVYNTTTWVSRDDPSYDTLDKFYAWLASVPDALAEFNHPGSIDPAGGGDFNNLEYHPEVADKIMLQEVGNDAQHIYRFFPSEYNTSLRHGWHIAPANNSDNHDLDIGADTPHRTGVIAPSLTRADIYDAIRARRVFATEDDNLAIALQSGSMWMGSTIRAEQYLTFTVTISDPDAEPFIVRIYDNGNPVARHQFDANTTGTWTVSIPGWRRHFYYAKGNQADGDYAYTAPIWTDDTYVPPIYPEATPIQDARALPLGKLVTVEGWVTVAPCSFDLYGHEMMIADATGGIDVYFPFPHQFACTIRVGEHVFITGDLVEFNGLLEIRPRTNADIVRVNDGLQVPEPALHSTGGFGESDEAHLVQIQGQVVGFGSLYLDDGSGSIEVYNSKYTGVSFEGITRGSIVKIVGVVYQYDADAPYTEGYHIRPRSPVDVTVVELAEPPPKAPGGRGYELGPNAISIAHTTRLNNYVTIEGNVTVPPGVISSSDLWLQDATGGIKVYLSSRVGKFPPIKLGDRVNVRGRVISSFGEREVSIESLENLRVLGPGSAPAATVLKTGDVTTAYEGLLVQLTGFVTSVKGRDIYLDDASGEIHIYVDSTTRIKIPHLARGDVLRVIGVVSRFSGVPEILPRFQDDLLVGVSFLPVAGDESRYTVRAQRQPPSPAQPRAFITPESDDAPELPAPTPVIHRANPQPAPAPLPLALDGETLVTALALLAFLSAGGLALIALGMRMKGK